MIRILSALVLSLTMIAAVDAGPQAPAPQQGNNQAQPDTRPIVHKGSEDLQGMGDLMFTFRADGTVEMIDATKRPVRGTYTAINNRITISFGNCVYEGTEANNMLTGVGRFTTGPNAGHTWNFSTQFAGRL